MFIATLYTLGSYSRGTLNITTMKINKYFRSRTELNFQS